MKTIRGFLSENFQFLEVIFSIYLNRRVFVMPCCFFLVEKTMDFSITTYTFTRHRSPYIPAVNKMPSVCAMAKECDVFSFELHSNMFNLHFNGDVRGMFEMNCLFLSGDFKFQVSPKVLISCPRSTPRG